MPSFWRQRNLKFRWQLYLIVVEFHSAVVSVQQADPFNPIFLVIVKHFHVIVTKQV